MDVLNVLGVLLESLDDLAVILVCGSLELLLAL
jgi:hypothetical protein